jgi:hypothetical protein
MTLFMKNEWIFGIGPSLVKMSGQLIVGLSVMFMPNIKLWFLIPWIMGWLLYDYGTMLRNRL